MKRQRGFSLVEALITVLVLSVGLTGIARFQLHAWRSGLDASRRADALRLLSEQLDTLRMNASLTAVPASGADEPAADHTRFTRRWFYTPADAAFATARASLTWQDGARQQSLSLATLVNRRPRAQDGAWVVRYE